MTDEQSHNPNQQEPAQQGQAPQEAGQQAKPPFSPAPRKPSPGSIVSAPLTGGGPHKAENAHGPPAAGTVNQTPKPPKPPRPQQPESQPAQQPRPAASVSAEQPGPVHSQGQPAAYPPGARQHPGWFDPSLGQPFPVGNEAMASLMTQALNAQRPASQEFILFVVPEDDMPRAERFETIQKLIDRIKELLGTYCHVFPVMGKQLGITKGPNRFLTTPMGALPLFDVPDPETEEEAEYGWVGPEMNRPQAPTGDSIEEAVVGQENSEATNQQPAADESDEEEEEQQVEEGGTPMF